MLDKNNAIGQLNKILDDLEEEGTLNREEYFEAADSVATLTAYIRLACSAVAKKEKTIDESICSQCYNPPYCRDLGKCALSKD